MGETVVHWICNLAAYKLDDQLTRTLSRRIENEAWQDQRYAIFWVRQGFRCAERGSSSTRGRLS